MNEQLSNYLNLMRWMAAFLVVIGHLRSFPFIVFMLALLKFYGVNLVLMQPNELIFYIFSFLILIYIFSICMYFIFEKKYASFTDLLVKKI